MKIVWGGGFSFLWFNHRSWCIHIHVLVDSGVLNFPFFRVFYVGLCLVGLSCTGAEIMCGHFMWIVGMESLCRIHSNGLFDHLKMHLRMQTDNSESESVLFISERTIAPTLSGGLFTIVCDNPLSRVQAFKFVSLRVCTLHWHIHTLTVKVLTLGHCMRRRTYLSPDSESYTYMFPLAGGGLTNETFDFTRTLKISHSELTIATFELNYVRACSWSILRYTVYIVTVYMYV